MQQRDFIIVIIWNRKEKLLIYHFEQFIVVQTTH